MGDRRFRTLVAGLSPLSALWTNARAAAAPPPASQQRPMLEGAAAIAYFDRIATAA